MAEKLKLRAEDEEDVQVLSACLQDALVAIGDMKFQKDERRFVLVASRFCWEDENVDTFPTMDDGETDDELLHQRVHCGIRFENVTAVKARGFSPRDAGRILELLAVTLEGTAEQPEVRLIFAGDAEILLKAERLLCLMEDLDDHWPTAFRPKHPVAPPDQNG